jgi:acyl carrier protein
MDMHSTLASFISDELLRSGETIAGDENLLSEGMVDSIGMLRLVGFIEDTYGLKVPPKDFVIENFRTLDVICGYLERTLGGGAGS